MTKVIVPPIRLVKSVILGALKPKEELALHISEGPYTADLIGPGPWHVEERLGEIIMAKFPKEFQILNNEEPEASEESVATETAEDSPALVDQEKSEAKRKEKK